MLCEKCKIREANVLLTEMSNGEVRTHHYCMKCASSLNIPNNPLLEDFPIAKMLAGLLSMQTSADEDMTDIWISNVLHAIPNILMWHRVRSSDVRTAMRSLICL